MKYVNEKYGMPVNLLSVSHEEAIQLEQFLRQLGIRCRTTYSDSINCIIEAENPYKIWADDVTKIKADKEMTEDSINNYKR